jgi:hypothetical protein
MSCCVNLCNYILYETLSARWDHWVLFGKIKYLSEIEMLHLQESFIKFRAKLLLPNLSLLLFSFIEVPNCDMGADKDKLGIPSTFSRLFFSFDLPRFGRPTRHSTSPDSSRSCRQERIWDFYYGAKL